jgi:hypothetical protein
MRRDEMTLSKKVPLVTLVFVVMLVPLGQLSAVHSDLSLPQTLEAKAFACLADVYPVDLNHYNVTLGVCCTLSSDTFITQAVDYMLNSPDSNLVANFLFKDAVLYSLSLSVINGSVATARPYDNLTDAARDFLLKYQAFSGADSTDLIRLLNHFDETKNTPVTLGNTSLSVSHLVIPTVENVTSFDWIYTLNGGDDAVVGIGFNDGTFYSFFDARQLYAVGSEEAINTAMKYIGNYSYTLSNGSQVKGFNVNKESAVAEFFTSPRNGSVLYPCWNVTLNLDQMYSGGVNALQLDVWADSGEVFNCSNQAVGSVPVDDSSSGPTPTNANLALSAETSPPNFLIAGIIGTVAAVTATTVAVLIVVKRRCK